jgi:hypothetical protein
MGCQLNVFSDYTYTLETIIQAGRKNMPIVSIACALQCADCYEGIASLNSRVWRV